MLCTLFRDRRIELGLAIRDLTAKTGISGQHLRDLEAGRRQPGLKTLLLLQDLLTLPTSAWLGVYLAEESRLLPLIQLAEHLVQVRDLGGASIVLRRLRALSHADRRYQGRLYHLYGLLTYHEGRYARARHWFKLAETSMSKSPNAAKRAESFYNSALATVQTGLLSQGAAKFDEAATAFQSLGDVRKAGYSRLSKANALMQMQSYREAHPVYRRAAFDLRGDPWFFDCKLGEVICRWRTRSPESALGLMVSLKKFAADPDRAARYHHNLAVIYRQVGALDDAMTHLTIALESSIPELLPRPESFAEMCLCRTLAGDVSGALEMLGRFKAFEGTKDPPDVLAVTVLAHVLGRGAPEDPLPRHVVEGYEQRLTAAICLLHSSPARLL